MTAPKDLITFMDTAPQSLGEMFAQRVASNPNDEAFRFPRADDTWGSLTWAETDRRVQVLAAGFLALGLGVEERVSIASSTRIEWILIDLAVNLAAAATTTIYPNTQAVEFDHIISHSDSRILVAENQAQVAKLHENPEASAKVQYSILMDGEGDGQQVYSWKQFVALGTEYLNQHPECVRDRVAVTSPETLATLIYTSGTTGLPKGVELTHKNWIYEGLAMKHLEIVSPNDVQYLWLPLSHVFGKCLIACQFAIGFSSVVDGRIDKIVGGLGQTHPTLMCGAPRIFEKVRAAVMTGNKGLKGRIARWAFAVGRDSRPYRLAGTKMPKLLSAKYLVAERLVFDKLKKTMGGNIDFFISGSAKLSPQVQLWFYSAGLLVVEGYGSTETSAIAFVNHPKTPRFGTVGQASPGTQVRIAEDGEILIKGDGVMRAYHKEPELTAEVLVDGWFHTGDIGELDEEGYLTITDRKKDLLKTSGGKYVAPQKVEAVIAANIPYVSQVVAVGDGRKYISALLTLDRDNLLKWAKRRGKDGMTYEELTQLPEIHASISRFMRRANTRLERWETVKRFAILDHEFTVEDGGVTANMKVRRSHITRQYAAVVDSLYDDEDLDE